MQKFLSNPARFRPKTLPIRSGLLSGENPGPETISTPLTAANPDFA